MRFAPGLLLLSIFCLLVPACALTPGDTPALRAVLDYGEANFDPPSGLIRDAVGTPNLAESSLGYVVAALTLQQDTERAKSVFSKLLDLQAKTGHFPWYAVAGSQPSEAASLYMAPLLAYLHLHQAAALGDLDPRLNSALVLLQTALPKIKVSPLDDTRFLLRAAGRAMVGAALSQDGPAAAAGDVAAWLRLVSVQGLPQGHSPTSDATRLVALKWVREVAPEAQKAAVEQALTLAAVDLGSRVDPTSLYPAGAIYQAYPADYASATGFVQYVLYTDFGQALPDRVDPYVLAALAPAWRAPQSVKALADPGASTMLRTRGPDPVRATDTYLGANYSLGTMCGEVSDSTLPIFLTFARTARPDAYFYCTPSASVQSVQADGLSLSSFNFDDLATPNRRQAFVKGVLGHPEDIEEVYCYGVKWNDLPTSLGEMETLAFTTRGCYVGLTLTRVGPAGNQSGNPAKPATLRWSGEGRKGDLVLTIYARQAEYTLPQPENNVRAGVVVEVAPQMAYLTLADFVKHLAQGQIKQNLRTLRQRVPGAEKPRDPNVIIPDPQSKIDMIYRDTVEQTTTYTNGERSLTLVEDLIGNIPLQRQINGTLLDEKYLWEADKFKYDPATKLTDALAPFGG